MVCGEHSSRASIMDLIDALCNFEQLCSKAASLDRPFLGSKVGNVKAPMTPTRKVAQGWPGAPGPP